LRGADEGAGAALDGGAEGGEVASGLGRHKEYDLLRFVGDGDEGALFADFFIPGFDADEPAIGRGVGGAAEEGADEEVVDGLAGGEVGVQPDAIAGLKVWDGGDGERDAVAGDANVNAGAGEVEAGIDCVKGLQEAE